MSQQNESYGQEKSKGFDYSFAMFIAVVALVILYLVLPRNETMAAISAGLVSGGSGMSPEDQVRELLRDPDSAQFRYTRRSGKDSRVMCGEVNSRNGFGGMAGWTRVVSDSGDGSVFFEAPGDNRPDQGFAGKWAAYCR